MKDLNKIEETEKQVTEQNDLKNEASESTAIILPEVPEKKTGEKVKNKSGRMKKTPIAEPVAEVETSGKKIGKSNGKKAPEKGKIETEPMVQNVPLTEPEEKTAVEKNAKKDKKKVKKAEEKVDKLKKKVKKAKKKDVKKSKLKSLKEKLEKALKKWKNKAEK